MQNQRHNPSYSNAKIETQLNSNAKIETQLNSNAKIETQLNSNAKTETQLNSNARFTSPHYLSMFWCLFCCYSGKTLKNKTKIDLTWSNLVLAAGGQVGNQTGSITEHLLVLGISPDGFL